MGQFAVVADTRVREVELGESVPVRLEITGTGNLAMFEPPQLDANSGFRVLGLLDDRGARRRTLVYDLAARSAEVRAVPPLELHYFDPDEERYRSAASAPLPIRVRARADEEDGGAPRTREVPLRSTGANESSISGNGAQKASSPWRWLPVVALALGAGLAIGAVLARRRAASSASSSSGEDHARVANAAQALRSAFATPGARPDDLLDPLADFLAARLGCERAVVFDHECERRLIAHGMSPTAAARVARTLEALVHARYGDGAPPSRAALTELLGLLGARPSS